MGHHSYVVSADIAILLSQWAGRQRFTLPPPDFFHELRDEFSDYMRFMFPSFELIPEAELTDGLARLVQRSGLYPVTLDSVYFLPVSQLEITRCVDSENSDCGLRKRAGTPCLRAQMDKIKASGAKDVVLVDDVIFSGELVARVITLLERIGVRVRSVCAGIGVRDGIRRIANHGPSVRCVRSYEEVIDQVCERDFYPGVPFSGRLLVNSDNVGVPYLLPFGNPGKWASIPASHQLRFSRHCLQAAIDLFMAIEHQSARTVMSNDLDRGVVHVPRAGRFVELLQVFL